MSGLYRGLSSIEINVDHLLSDIYHSNEDTNRIAHVHTIWICSRTVCPEWRPIPLVKV